MSNPVYPVRATVMQIPVILIIVCLMATGIALPRVAGATIQVGSASVTAGTTFTVPVIVNAGAIPLGGYTVAIGYDATLVKITGVTGGDAIEFSGVPLANTNVLGVVSIGGQNLSSLTTPTGLVSVARINFIANGPTGSSPLTLSSADAYDTAINTLTLSTGNGLVTILPPLSCEVTPSGAAICAGESQILVANPSGGLAPYSYAWSNDVLTQSNTVRSAGTYICTITDANHTTTQCSGVLTVHPLPTTPSASNNGPVCNGSPLHLTTAMVSGAIYSWTGPDGFTSSEQNPAVANATPAASGLYRVTVTVSGCTSAAGTTTATVNPTSVGGLATATPATVASDSGTTITLTDQTGAIVKWQSSQNNSTWSDLVSTDNPYATGNLTATTYFQAVVQSATCPSANSVSAQVTVGTNGPPDTTPPLLAILNPADYQIFTNTGIAVTGTATDASGINGVTINGAGSSLVGTNWQTPILLDLGTNTFTVIATDSSANRNTTTQLVHAVYTGPLSNRPPVIIVAPSVTNALLVVSNQVIVIAGETNIFAVTAADPDHNPLTYLWIFGDGATNAESAVSFATHAYAISNCGPYTTSVTVSDGQLSVRSNLTVAVACALLTNRPVWRLSATVHFTQLSNDTARLAARMDLGTALNVSNQVVTVDIGGAQRSFNLDPKGRGILPLRNSKGQTIGSLGVCRLTYNPHTALWTFTATLSRGTWQAPWDAYGLHDTNITARANYQVTLPVTVLVGSDAFAAEPQLHYTATHTKFGTAK